MKNYIIKIWNWIKNKVWPEAKVYELTESFVPKLADNRHWSII